TYNAYVGSKVPAHVPTMMNAQQFYEAYNSQRQIDAVAVGLNAPKPRGWTESEIANATSGRTTDWIDLVTGPGLQMSHTLSVSGGTEKTRYNFSAGYLDEDGNSQGSDFKRYTVNAGLESQIHKMVKVGFTSYSSFSDRSLPTSELLRSSYRARPTGTVKFEDLAPADQANDLDFKGNAFFIGVDDNQVFNSLTEVDPENARHETKVASILANGFIEFTPLEGLSLRSSISTLISNNRDGEYWGNFTKTQRGTRGNKAQYGTENGASYTLDNIITYETEVGDHDFKITGLQSVFQQRDEETFTAAQALPYRSLWHNLGTGELTAFETGLSERSLLSFMGRLNYGYKDKYLLTLTGRSDGASQLSEGNKWIFYPSVAVAWRLGEEDFIQNSNFFSDLKLRASYGIVGNASSVRPYDTQANITQTNYDFGGSSAPGFAIGALANRDLVYEKSKELNIGLNFGFFNNRISGEIEWYDRKTVDLIIGDKIPTSTGFTDVVANVGEIQNKGIELTLNTVNVATKDFKWMTTLTFTKNNDKVTKLAGGITEDIGNLRFVGESVFPFYSWEFDGIWQLDQAAEAAEFDQVPGQVRLVDLDNDGEITDADRKIVGKGTPDFIAGLRNKISYKNVDFSFFVYTRQGLMYNNQYLRGTFGDVGSDRYNRSSEIDIWTSTNPSNTYFGLNGPGLSNHPVRGNTRVALQNQEANFVRISDITLGYTLPRAALDKLGFSNFRVYAQAANPFVFTNFLGFNPEYNSSVSNDDLPFATYLVGVNLSF
ncbi:MAG: TonB-linked SusC/RagA family outer membrane protein, partial [Saprospiraceae bacterium]